MEASWGDEICASVERWKEFGEFTLWRMIRGIAHLSAPLLSCGLKRLGR